MRRPDIRQRVIEAVLDLAAAAGVDDVHLIAALALHRRMTEAELRHAVGDRVYDAFAPQRPALQPRRRGPGQPRRPRHHRPGRGRRDQQAGRRERPARLRQHQPRGDGRRPQVRPPPGLASYRSIAPPPQRAHDAALRSFMDRHAVRAALGQLAHGRRDPQRRREDLPDRDDAQQRHVRPVRPAVDAAEARVGVDRARPGHVHRR